MKYPAVIVIIYQSMQLKTHIFNVYSNNEKTSILQNIFTIILIMNNIIYDYYRYFYHSHNDRCKNT